MPCYVDVSEFCDDESFVAECPRGQMVMIDYALYGRMNKNRCISYDYGFMGCSTDVVRHLDKRCSDRRSCEVGVAKLSRDGAKPCPQDFRHFLMANYTCQEGELVFSSDNTNKLLTCH